MLLIIDNMKQLQTELLLRVYRQSNVDNGKVYYPRYSCTEQLRQAENDLLDYLRVMFQTDREAFCAAWVTEGEYGAFLRMEQYRDGLLLNSLETAQAARGRGYATALVRAVLEYVNGKPVYSHIHKQNKASIAVHEKCGFRRILDYAVYLDGSVLRSDATYLFVP